MLIGEGDLARDLLEVDPDGEGGLPLDVELQVLHRREPLLAALRLVEPREDLPPIGKLDVERLGQGDPAAELLDPIRRIVDLDQERAGQLTRPAEEAVVGVELVLGCPPPSRSARRAIISCTW